MPTVDRIRVFVVMPAHTAPDTLTFTISTSDDEAAPGKKWAAPLVDRPISPPDPYPPDLVRVVRSFCIPRLLFSSHHAADTTR